MTILRLVGPVISTRRSWQRVGRRGDRASRPRGRRASAGSRACRRRRARPGAPRARRAARGGGRRARGAGARRSSSAPGGEHLVRSASGDVGPCTSMPRASRKRSRLLAPGSSAPAARSGGAPAAPGRGARCATAIWSAQPGLAAATASAPVASRLSALRAPSSAAGSGLSRL